MTVRLENNVSSIAITIFQGCFFYASMTFYDLSNQMSFHLSKQDRKKFIYTGQLFNDILFAVAFTLGKANHTHLTRSCMRLEGAEETGEAAGPAAMGSRPKRLDPTQHQVP